MATYKVPQDVEADDKLIGPFSFRQFVYLIIVALAGFIAWALSQIFIGLALIPMPVILLFGALALPLRKDQPMEIYLAAIVSFYLKPHQRTWDPEGVESLIEVTAPRVVEQSRTKDLSHDEAERRLGYLANIVDSGGWAIRGGGPDPNSAMVADVFYDAQNTSDPLDTNNSVAQSFDYLMKQRAEEAKQETLAKMRSALLNQADQTVAAAPTPAPTAQMPTPTQIPATEPISATPQNTPQVDPVDGMHQKVIQPLSDNVAAAQPSSDLANALAAAIAPATPQTSAYLPTEEPQQQTATENPQSTSDTPVSPDIINLATNPDLSVATLSKEAHRLQAKAASEDEVFISLR